MATFTELQQAFGDGEMIDLAKSAILKLSAAILAETTPSADRLQFAQESLATPGKYAGMLWRFVVGKNADAAIGVILRSQGSPTSPTDATIESEISEAINKLWP